jgi:hypothetical protein
MLERGLAAYRCSKSSRTPQMQCPMVAARADMCISYRLWRTNDRIGTCGWCSDAHRKRVRHPVNGAPVGVGWLPRATRRPMALLRRFALQWSAFAACFTAFIIGEPEVRWSLAPRLRRWFRSRTRMATRHAIVRPVISLDNLDEKSGSG